MAYRFCWLGLLGLSLLDQPVASSPPRGGGAVKVKLAPGPYLVGQGITLDVISDQANERESLGEVEPPRIPQADLVAVDPARSGPAGGVLARFFLVPRRSGNLTIPPFRVRQGGHVVASKPSIVSVANPSPNGRTPAFLGGVGDFRVAGQVEPKSVRVGEPVEVEIKMSGLAAVGSTLTPDVSPWLKLAAAFQIRDTSSHLDRSDPPTRTYRYRLRPTQPGRAVLPPIPLAAFDPGSKGYTTRYTPSLVVTIEGPPRFDPSRIDLGTDSMRGATSNDLRRRVALGLALSVGGAGVALGVAWPTLRRRIARFRVDRPVSWRSEASRLARATLDLRNRIEVAEEVADRFARAIALATKQPVAVLTPEEAESAVLALTNDERLSRKAGRLVAALDEARFDPDAEATVGDRNPVAEAVAVFRAIGRKAGPPARG